MTARVVESGVGVGGVACFQLESESFFQNCWSRSRVFKNAGVGVGSRSRFFKTAGVGVGFSKLLESESGVGILKNLPTPQPWFLVVASSF